MTDDEKALIEVAEAEVERQSGQIQSRQPRFTAQSPEQFYLSVLRFSKLAYMDQPEYKTDSRKRDKWLTEVPKMEPYLGGVLNSVVAIDKNRGWTMIGGRNLVNRYTRIWHNGENGAGWRALTGLHAQSFYSTDMNGIIETAREGEEGPVQALWHVDPTRCVLTGDLEFPLTYYPSRGKKQKWRASDFFRTSSLRNTDETFNQLGYCAISRCVVLAQTMIAIMEHDQEQLGARAPQGLLLIHGISQEQWQQAMDSREADLTAKERMYYGGVQVLASLGAEKVDARLVALSNLPANFDKRTFTDLTMFGYALAFGYDPTEFWPVQFGALGRGRESEVQHEKATGKGGKDFSLEYQENLQKELPDTVHFEFDERDDEAELVEANVALAKLRVITELYEAGLRVGGKSLASWEEARSLTAEQGIIPREWTEIEEESESTDTEAAERQRIRDLPEVQRCAYEMPKEPIVIYEWPKHRQRILWHRADDMLKPRVWQVKKRQVEVLFEEDDVIITEEDANLAIENADEEIKEFLEVEEIEDNE